VLAAGRLTPKSSGSKLGPVRRRGAEDPQGSGGPVASLVTFDAGTRERQADSTPPRTLRALGAFAARAGGGPAISVVRGRGATRPGLSGRWRYSPSPAVGTFQGIPASLASFSTHFSHLRSIDFMSSWWKVST